MTQTPNPNHSRPFIQHEPTSIVVVAVIFLFMLLPVTTNAQIGTLSSPPPDPFNFSPGFNPTMAIAMVVLVSAFFTIGFFSVCIRQCGHGRNGHNSDPTATGVVGRRSRRAAAVGLDPAVIEAFPTFVYSTVKGLKIGKGSLECAVCLSEFEDDQTLRLIPKCNHVFHPDCIDAWLASQTTCPVCRANLVPKPGDMPSGSVHFFELDENPVERDGETQDRVVVNVPDDGDHDREVALTHSRRANLLSSINQNWLPPRSRSTGWRLSKLFPRSHSTGHSLVQPRDNCERFTLRLPEEVRSQLLNTHLNRTKSCVVFPRARSSTRGFRSGSIGSGPSRNYLAYERLDHEARLGSVRSLKGLRGSDEVKSVTPKNFLKPVKSPIDRLFLGIDNRSSNDNNKSKDVGERSTDQLVPPDGGQS